MAERNFENRRSTRRTPSPSPQPARTPSPPPQPPFTPQTPPVARSYDVPDRDDETNEQAGCYSLNWQSEPLHENIFPLRESNDTDVACQSNDMHITAVEVQQGYRPPLEKPASQSHLNDSLDKNTYEEVVVMHSPISAVSTSQEICEDSHYETPIENQGALSSGLPQERGDLQQSWDNMAEFTSNIDVMKKWFERSPEDFLIKFESTNSQTRIDTETFIIVHILKATEPNSPILDGDLKKLALLACCSSPHVVQRALDGLLNEIFLSISNFRRNRCRNILQAENIIRQSFDKFMKNEHAKAKCQRLTTYAWLITFVLLKCSKEEFAQIATELRAFDGTLEALLRIIANEKNTFRYGIVLARETINHIVHSRGKKTLYDIEKYENFLTSALEKREVRDFVKALKQSWLNLHICMVFLQDLPKLPKFQGNSKPITLLQMIIQDYRDCSPRTSVWQKAKAAFKQSAKPQPWRFEVLVYHVMLRLIRTSNKEIVEQVLIGEQGCGGVLCTQLSQNRQKTTSNAFVENNRLKILEKTVFCTPMILNLLIENNGTGDVQNFIEKLSLLHLRSKYEVGVLEVWQKSEVPRSNTCVSPYDIRMNNKKCLLKVYRHTEDDLMDSRGQKNVSLRQEIEIVQVLNAQEVPCPNIVQLLGCSSIEAPIHMIIESSDMGDLLSFLKNHVAAKEVQNLRQIALNICDAMMFLGNQNIIHRDLRAINCFVFMQEGKPLAKLGDFRQAVILPGPRSMIMRNLPHGLAMPWMAVETLRHCEFSTASDVWSFGVLLFEIFTYGSKPYVNMPPNGLSLNDEKDIRKYVTNGNRLVLHPIIPGSIRYLIRSTMADADSRPTFSDLRSLLGGMSFKSEAYVDRTYFQISNDNNVISEPVSATTTSACTADGCLGECLNASDVAVPSKVGDTHVMKEFIPTSVTYILTLSKLKCPSLAVMIEIVFHDEKLQLIFGVGDMGNFKEFILSFGCSMGNPMRYLLQIGEAVSFLHSKRFIHRNLRATSASVYSDGNAKLACLARVRRLKPNADHPSSTIPINLPMPEDSLRWSSPEVITDGEYSEASDMWAFGVLIWETFAFIDKHDEGDESDKEIIPYDQLTTKDQILSYLKKGRRLGQPKSCPDWLYDMMLSCWKLNTRDRATAQDIVQCINTNEPGIRIVHELHAAPTV